MPTVSDLISIELEIDDTGLQLGGDAALREIERVKAKLKSQGDDIEHLVKNIGENVNTALHYIAGLMGVVLTFEGFKNMVHQVVESGTALGRFSEAVDISAGKVGAFEQALERAGGRVEDVRPVLAAMQSDITRVKTMGTAPPEWMRRLALPPFNMTGRELMDQSAEETLRQVAGKAQAGKITPMQLKLFLSGLPLSPETLAVLTKPGELERLLKEVQPTAPTQEQIGAAERLKEKFATLGQLSTATMRDLVTLSEPFLNSILDGLRIALDWLDRIERRFGGASTAGLDTGPPLPRVRIGGMVGSRPSFGGYRPRRGPVTGGGSPGTRSDVRGPQPASIRYNNPGAQYPSERSKLFGQEGYGVISGGHLIAKFPTAEQGAAANMDLFYRNYTNMQLGAAGQKWTGGYGFGVPGYDPNTVITQDMMRDPNFAIPLMKSIARREAGHESPLTEDEWRRAHDLFVRNIGVPTNSAAAGQVKPNQQERPFHYSGTLEMEGATYPFGTGGAGRGSIPYGDFPVTPNTIGPWGTAHGAIGVNNNSIYDPKLSSFREGIELHSGSSEQLITEGCVAIAGPQWPRFKAHVMDMISRYGSVTLHVGPEGAAVMPTSVFRAYKGLSVGPKAAAALAGLAGTPLPNVATGAAAAALAPGIENRTINNEREAVINHVTVHTNATDAGGIAKDVKDEIGRQLATPEVDLTK